jgi:hypothetical protein
MSIEALADQIQAERAARLLEPSTVPGPFRRWKRRPRPQTAIVGEAANWLADDYQTNRWGQQQSMKTVEI